MKKKKCKCSPYANEVCDICQGVVGKILKDKKPAKKKAVYRVSRKKNVTVTPLYNQGGENTPADLKIKYGVKVTVGWDTLCDWMSSLFSRRKK